MLHAFGDTNLGVAVPRHDGRKVAGHEILNLSAQHKLDFGRFWATALVTRPAIGQDLVEPLGPLDRQSLTAPNDPLLVLIDGQSPVGLFE